MSIKVSEDLVPLTDLKANPARVVNQTQETKRPVVLTNRGRGVAVVQSLEAYEQAQDERDFMRGVVAGLKDLEDGQELSLAKTKKRLRLK